MKKITRTTIILRKIWSNKRNYQAPHNESILKIRYLLLQLLSPPRLYFGLGIAITWCVPGSSCTSFHIYVKSSDFRSNLCILRIIMSFFLNFNFLKNILFCQWLPILTLFCIQRAYLGRSGSQVIYAGMVFA